MTLYIKPSKIFFFDIFIGEKSFFKETPFVEKASLLNKAINTLEDDINSIANSVNTNKYFNFFWEFTYDIHRDDGLKDTVLDYYLLGIITDLNKKHTIKKVEIQYFLSKPIIDKISKIIPVNIKFSKRHYINEFIRYQFGPIKYLKKYLTHTIAVRGKTKLLSNNNVFFLTGNNFSTVRSREFPVMMDEKFDVHLMNFSLTKLKNYSNKKEFKLDSYSLKLFFISFFKTINLYRSLKSTLKKTKFHSIYSLKLMKQSFLQTYYLVLRYETLNKIFSNYRLKYIVATTTIGDPAKRMVLSVAKSYGIRTIVFSCRSILSYLRAEDRVMSLDFNKLNGFFFTDYFISFDKISKQHLISSGVDKNKLYTYNEVEETNIQGTYNDGILLLFASTLYNDRLLELFELAVERGCEFNKVYYREHPNKGISMDHMSKFKSIFKQVICINKFNWTQIKFNNVLAFTSNSTSGIDASSRGASIVWLPFLTEQGTQFKPMMDAIGKVCYDENEFISFIKYLTKKNRLLFNDKCKKQYYQNIYETSTMSQFFDNVFKKKV